MAFFGPLLAKSAMGGPFCFAVVGSALVVSYAVIKITTNSAQRNNAQRNARAESEIRKRQERGELDSSDVEGYLNLGTYGTYESVVVAGGIAEVPGPRSRLINDKRPFSKGKNGDKFYVEADHIPPLDSLRRAAQNPEFRRLMQINRALYDMVRSLENDPRGRNLFALQVPTHNHRAALSTGSSRESVDVRGLLACRITRGEAKTMLKQAMMIAHPFVSERIRDQAGIWRGSPQERSLLSRDRTMNYYRDGFLGLINFMYKRGVINEKERDELYDFVLNHGYFDINSSEYQEILETVKRSKK